MNIPELRERVERGEVFAASILGCCYLEGIEVGADYSEAFRLLSFAAEQGASRAVGRMYAEGLGTKKDMRQAVALFTPSADKGEFLAQVMLGRLYSRGDGDITRNPLEAEKWYQRAAQQRERVQDCDELAEAVSYLSKPPGTPS